MLANPVLGLVLLISCFENCVRCSPDEQAINQIAGHYQDRLERYDGGKLIIFSDFNGVLSNKEDNRGARSAKESVRETLRELGSKDHIVPYVSSSKPLAKLEQLLPDVGPVGLVGEHGLDVKSPDGTHSRPRHFPHAWADYIAGAIQALKEELSQWKDLKVKDEEHLYSFSFKAPHDYSETLNDGILKRYSEIVATAEKPDDKGMIKHWVSSTFKGKGKYVREILNQAGESLTFGVSLGDKEADVSMHQEMSEKGFAGVIVGSKVPSSSYYHLENQASVPILFERLQNVHDEFFKHRS